MRIVSAKATSLLSSVISGVGLEVGGASRASSYAELPMIWKQHGGCMWL